MSILVCFVNQTGYHPVRANYRYRPQCQYHDRMQLYITYKHDLGWDLVRSHESFLNSIMEIFHFTQGILENNMSIYSFKWYLFACWRVYGILPTFVPGPKHPLANKLFDMFGVNHGTERLWPISWHVAWGRPNQVHRRHPHTMGDDPCAWFGDISSTAQVGRSVTQSQKMLQLRYWWCCGWMSIISWCFTNILTLKDP